MGRSADLPRQSGQTDGDDAASPILHVDMDAFYASVEIRRRPELAGRPVIVGGGTRGVVSAASYEARRYGVFSAMPMSIALRRCPRAVVLPVDRSAYVEASRAVMAILADVTELVEPLSLDEAFLDVTGAQRLLGRPAEIARLIRRRVAQEQNLTCSVGIAPSKFVAKVASARCKPDGMLVIPVDGVLDFLHPLPITALWGVGPSTAERLQRLGLRTVGDVAGTPLAVLARAVGTSSADHLFALANGIDHRPVVRDQMEKSVSSDCTFDTDLCTESEVRRELLRLSEEVAERLRSRGLVARTVGIKVRFADFRTVSRVRTLGEPVDLAATCFAESLALYRSLGLDRPRIRLLGVKAEGLVDAASVSHQLTFDDVEPVSTTAPAPTGPRPGAPAREVRVEPARVNESPPTPALPPSPGDDHRDDHDDDLGVDHQGDERDDHYRDQRDGNRHRGDLDGKHHGDERGNHRGSHRGDLLVNDVPAGSRSAATRVSAAERVADAARRRFGPAAVRKASLLDRTGPLEGPKNPRR